MNKRTDNKQLLEDVFAGEPDDVREASLENILRLASHRRRTRTVRRVGSIAVVLFALATVGIRFYTAREKADMVAKTSTMPAHFAYVQTQPLLTTQVVTTQPLLPGQWVSSLELTGVVHTVRGNYREVGDEELLALAAPQIVALVRRGPHDAELLFISPQAGGEN